MWHAGWENGSMADADVLGECEWRESSAHMCEWACIGRSLVVIGLMLPVVLLPMRIHVEEIQERDEKEDRGQRSFEQNSCHIYWVKAVCKLKRCITGLGTTAKKNEIA